MGKKRTTNPEPPPTTAPDPSGGHGRWPLAAALLCALVFHLPSLAVPFHYDDFHHLADNPSILGLGGIGRLWLDPNTYSAIPGAPGLYRPLLMTSHALTAAVLGRGPFGFHLVNLCLHLVNTALAFSLFRRWGATGWAAAVAAAFFGVAAVNQETVAYASARSTLLAGAFGLGAVRLAEEDPDWRWAGLAGVCLLLGLFAKEIAATVPALMLARDLTRTDGGGRRRWPFYAAMLTAVAAYLAVRLALVPAFPATYTGRGQYFGGQGRVILYYLAKSLFPFGLTIYRGLPVSGGAVADLLSWAALAAAVAAAVVGRRRLGLAGLGILWFLAGFAVTSSVFPLLLTSSLERLYLPSLGLAAVGLEAWSRLSRLGRRQPTAAVAVAVVLLNGLTTLGLHLEWRSPGRLWRRAVRTAPFSGSTWQWLGRTEMEAGRYPRADLFLARALSLNPRDPYTHIQIAELLMRTGKEEEARVIWDRALKSGVRLEVQRLDALVNLATLDLKANRLDAARARAEQALTDYPDSAEAHLVAGLAASRAGDDQNALRLLERARALSPDNPLAASELGLLYLRRGENDRARSLLGAAAAGGADDANTLAGLGVLALQDQRLVEAGEKFEASLRQDPVNFIALLGMALNSAMQGNLDAAAGFADRAATVDPESAQVRDLRAQIRLDQAARAQGTERARALELARPDVEWLDARGAPARKAQWAALSQE